MNLKKIAYVFSNYTSRPDGIAIHSENLLFELSKSKKILIDIIINKKHKKFLLDRDKDNILSNSKANFIELNVNNKILEIFITFFIINTKSYNLIIFPSIYLSFSIKNKSIKIIHDFTYKRYSESLSSLQIFYKNLTKLTLYFDNYIGYISMTTLKEIKKFAKNQIINSKLVYTPTCFYNSFPVTTNLIKNSNAINFLFVGSLNKHKGFDDSINFLNAFSDYSKEIAINVNFVGKVKKETRLILEKFKINKKINFTIHNYISDDELKSFYKISDFLLCLSKNEGFGIPIIESIKYGCLPIVSELEIFEEILSDKYELTLKKNYDQFFYNKILYLKKNISNYENLLDSLRKRTLKYNDNNLEAANNILKLL